VSVPSLGQPGIDYAPLPGLTLFYRVVQAPGDVDAWRFRVRLPGTAKVIWGEWQASEQQAQVAALEFAQRHGRFLEVE
jgi:hypothetical protein